MMAWFPLQNSWRRIALLLVFSAGLGNVVLAAGQPGLEIVEPAADATVDGPNVSILVAAEGVELGSRDRNGAHVLLQLDELPAMKSYAERFTFRGVAAGPHTLRAELRRPDGGPFDPPVKAEVKFSVSSRPDSARE